MALEVGSRLGHYDVTVLIGEGGMGQVYQATDTKLNRQVALKILPEAFATDPDRLARFQREAQVLASLNHPNIAQIHGLEDSEGTKALVLELVEGPTLADRIKQGPIPVEEALPIAKQIAEALEAAHEQGVIHRDLKPVVVADNDVWIYDIATGRRSAVTTDGLGINEAEWDPTGLRLPFSSQRAGTLNVFVQPADGSGTVRQLTSLEGSVEVDSWSPNGDVMAAHHHSPEGPTHILMIPVGEEGSAPQDFLVREFNEQGSVFSPDGRYVAYSSNESGQDEISIRPYPGPGSQVTVSVGGGTEPVWRDGELFYRRTNDDRMMAVSVRTGPELNVGDITELFEGDYWGFDTTPRPDYHVTADRSRFLMLTGGADTSLQEAIVVVQNWSQELLERVPVD